MSETPAWLARHLELMLPAGDDPAERLGSFRPGDLVTLAGEKGTWRVTSTASLHRSFAGGLALYTGYVCIRVCDNDPAASEIYTGARKADP